MVALGVVHRVRLWARPNGAAPLVTHVQPRQPRRTRPWHVGTLTRAHALGRISSSDSSSSRSAWRSIVRRPARGVMARFGFVADPLLPRPVALGRTLDGTVPGLLRQPHRGPHRQPPAAHGAHLRFAVGSDVRTRRRRQHRDRRTVHRRSLHRRRGRLDHAQLLLRGHRRSGRRRARRALAGVPRHPLPLRPDHRGRRARDDARESRRPTSTFRYSRRTRSSTPAASHPTSRYRSSPRSPCSVRSSSTSRDSSTS